ncbi:hypothetical protein EDD17DRAFT_743602 [Pisolithus thermaeus]|nr:hypothetical protein EDD17DRAFT_743602 [Pisolithus thermaeus]
MALLTTITGFSLFGLASRFGQLAIQKRNLMDSTSFHPSHLTRACSTCFRPYAPYAHNPYLGGHVVAMAAFGYAGYWAHVYETRTGEYLTTKRAEIAERRERKLEAREEAVKVGVIPA